MEIALEAAILTYAGGLGVLAGDTLRSAADLGAPIVGVTLLHRHGYFRQHVDAAGRQTESPDKLGRVIASMFFGRPAAYPKCLFVELEAIAAAIVNKLDNGNRCSF
jgi:glucan phosphorylase